MIVRPLGGGFQLITQLDHAHLARRIMERCVPLAARPRREPILLAIAEHDGGWVEIDAAPSFDAASGGVVDFVKAPLAVRQGVWPRAIARLEGEPWAAALVAHHAWFVYERFRTGADPEWSAFFTAMAAARDEQLAALGSTLDELLADYAFLRLGDLISLAFCNLAPEPLRHEEWTVRLAGTRVVVTPDAFGGAVVPFAIQAREIHGGPFRSAAALRAAFDEAAPTTLSGEVGGTAG
ncbi:MAG TPA: DUF3891 family protein [Thermoanaerobaculia bacterium]|jgi:hypothetical protein|nr:DUF3891 family protein [Thermoanaerobaculia bacterium]